MSVEHGAILVVDDEPIVREAFMESLEYEGYRAVEASNGKEALDYLRRHPPPCLVLLDLMMPVMNGFDVLTAIQKDPKLCEVPIIIVSAADREKVEETARSSAVVVGVLSKPVQLRPFLETVQKFC